MAQTTGVIQGLGSLEDSRTLIEQPKQAQEGVNSCEKDWNEETIDPVLPRSLRFVDRL